ncbi:hypothetical protein LWI28_002882 [Acer negundo]|uniref:Uncharacterized protein n=1 Tax=Acer negundo TaxID=4023 RepID=A0AAD5JCH5_ACENE|nr:hypothetical protein LWI28_002882 [Acer negundo]
MSYLSSESASHVCLIPDISETLLYYEDLSTLKQLFETNFSSFYHEKQDALSAKIIKVKSDLVGASDSVDHLARELKVVQEDLEKEQDKTSTVYTRIQELEDKLNKLIKKSKVDNINLLYETELHKTCDVKLATFKAQITKLEEKLALLILNDTIACKWSSRANSLP